MSKYCISCGRDISSISNNIIFNCPECGAEIVRCGDCRKLGIKYECKCGWSGL